MLSKQKLAQHGLPTLLFCLIGLLWLAPQWHWLPQDSATDVAFYDWLQFNLLPALLLLLGLLSVSAALKRSVWLCLPFSLLAAQEIFYQQNYDKAIDAHALAIIAETDLLEASGYLTGLTGWIVLWCVAVVLLFALCSWACGRAKWHWPRFIRLSILFSCVMALAWLWQQERQYKIDYPQQPGQNATETVLESRPLPQSYNLLHHSFPFNWLLAFNEYWYQQQVVSDITDKNQQFTFQASQVDAIKERQIYLLVIGETLRPDRLQLNGYHRATTPRLAGLNNVISFNNMISPWAWTRMSVPVMISRKPASSQQYFFHEKSLVAAFKEAGFNTYWLSTQSPLGVHDSSVGLHANEADEVQYLNPVGYKEAGFYDEILLPALGQVLARAEQKQLVVIHTLGSHFSYADRYPDNFDLFLPSGKAESLGMHDKNNKTKLNNAYDNTVAYTDFLLFNMITQLQQQTAISSLLYVSDHGENLFDGQCDKSGHGHNTEYDYRVAALWWGSAEFLQAYPQQVQRLKKQRQRPLMTSQVFHSLLDLAQIHYPTEQPQLSFASAAFKAPARLLASGADFDLSAKNKVCRALPLLKAKVEQP